MPQGCREDCPVTVRISVPRVVQVSHGHAGRKAAHMNDMFIMPLVPRPDVRRAKHRRGPIIRDGLVQSRLSIVLVIGKARSIYREICSVARDVMAVFVINDTGVM